MGNPLMSLINKKNMLYQLMSSQNPQLIVQDMIKKNPNLQQVWNQAQNLSQYNKEQVIEQICKEKGLNKDDVINQARSFGINIK